MWFDFASLFTATLIDSSGGMRDKNNRTVPSIL